MDEPSSRMQDPARRAERYQKVAEEYAELANAASSPFLRAYYLRIAEQYRMHAKGELSVLKREGAAATARSGHSGHPAAMRVDEAQDDFRTNALRACGPAPRRASRCSRISPGSPNERFSQGWVPL
jgi:hypothetical protein